MDPISKLKWLIFNILLLVHGTSMNASESDTLFKTDAIVEIELRSNFTAIDRERTGEPVYHGGELIYTGENGKSISMKVEVTSRGNFRRDPQNCDFPPLWVKFSDSETKNTLFNGQDRLKLVTPCQYDRDVIQEYLIYKMYNLVTEKSLKVRLFRISYYDTAKKRRLFERYSFFLEDADNAARRSECTETEKFVTPFDIDKDLYRKMSVFQFMIGNKDWFVSSRKNIIIIQPDDSSQAPSAIPYDFDFAGFVDADYTKPAGIPDERLASRRVYKGVCYTYPELKETFLFFEGLLPEFEALIRDTKMIPVLSQNEDIAYIREFFSSISDPNFVRQNFLTKCETRADYNLND